MQYGYVSQLFLIFFGGGALFWEYALVLLFTSWCIYINFLNQYDNASL